MSKYATFLRVIYDNENIIHSSGVFLTTNPVDKFFYDFKKNKYAVIGSTYTHENTEENNIIKKLYNCRLKISLQNLK